MIVSIYMGDYIKYIKRQGTIIDLFHDFKPVQLNDDVNVYIRVFDHEIMSWKKVWVLISWLLQKPADLVLHYFQKRLYPNRG